MRLELGQKDQVRAATPKSRTAEKLFIAEKHFYSMRYGQKRKLLLIILN